MTALSLRAISSAYGQSLVLDKLNLELAHGDIVALLGASGCGKSTLLHVIAGLQPIKSGEIIIKDKLVTRGQHLISSEQRGVGMIFQDYALFPHLSVAENILFGVKSKSYQEKQQLLIKMLELVKITPYAKAYPHELSGGQQQRVAIARALACKPSILLLDEPFSNIDPMVRHELIKDIRQILKTEKISAVFVTHSQDEAFLFADSLALLKDGHILQHGTSENLCLFPAEKYVAEFLGQGCFIPMEVCDAFNVKTPIGKVMSTTELSLPINFSGELLLRPQQVTLSPDKHGTGVIIDRCFQGYFCHYKVKIEQWVIDVKSNLTQLLPGEVVKLETAAHPLIIF